MAYVALYRKFRPNKFEDLVGQEPIVRTLLNQIESGRVAHAYLFTGPRGTGKTSTAKLFARAINCLEPVSGSPCGKCEACIASGKDENMDIIEIDAASNNGVDNIRDIRDKVVFAPAIGKYKVYIVDEVHMLSAGAFNALLKTLEEPPKHVVFILATTEIHKLPATILSRCQRFDFHLIPTETIQARLQYVLNQSNISFAPEAIELIAKTAEGGMRDALSLADVCVSYCGNNVSLQDAMNVLGISDRSFLFSIADSLIDSDLSGALEKCREAISAGTDIGVFSMELMQHLRDLLIAKNCPDSAEFKNLTGEVKEKLLAQAKRATDEHLLRSIEILSNLESQIKLYSRPGIQLETSIARICLPACEDDLSALKDRIDILENKMLGILSGNLAVNAKADNTKASESKTEPAPNSMDMPPWDMEPAESPAKPKSSEKIIEKATEPVKTQPAAKQSSIEEKGDIWKKLMAKINEKDKPLGIMIRNFSGAIQGERFVIYIPIGAAGKEALILKNKAKLEEFLQEITQSKLKIETFIGEKPKNSGEAQITEQSNTQENEKNDFMQAALDLFS